MRIRAWIVRLLFLSACIASAPASAVVSHVSATSTSPTGNNTSMVVSLPAGVQAGDLLLAQIALDGTTTLDTPAGWTLLQNDSNTIVQALYYRFATASETGNVTWTWSSNRRAAGGIALYRGVDSSQPPGAAAVDSDDDDDLEAPAQTVVEANSLLVTLYGLNRGNETLTAAGSMTTAYHRSSTDNSGVTLLASYEQRPATGSTGVRTASSSDSRAWIAHSLLLRPVPVSSGPLLSWSLDESSWTGVAGEVLDASGNALHGTVLYGAGTASSAPALPQVNAQGTCGYGVFNSGSSQYVQRAHSSLLNLQGSFTIGLWVKPRTLPASGLMSILSKDENYEFHLNPNGTINWWWQTTDNATHQFNSSTALTVGAWNHVLIRFAPNDQRIYINGNLAGQANFSGTPLANSDPLQLGADQAAAGRYFDGELDELRIYSQALSTAQIAALVTERHACALQLQCFNDAFNGSALGGDWAVASRGATAFTPAIVNGRMRLTSSQGNVATASTLQRLFPAAGNYIQVQFQHYAYSGSGADGMAIVLSDASVTPQPGAFGGPMGYGTRGDAANPGFAGGWLGVGIDEYGNFSTEGGSPSDGPGQRSDSVAMRGSGNGALGYRYIAGTGAGLNPGIDNAASTSPAPGHKYRITLDGRFSDEARVTVERDSGGGFVVLSNLNAVNVLAAAYSQAPLPSDFYLSLTGSTGGSTNIHELDDLQVCATNINPVTEQIDHFDFVYANPALTCSPQEVIVRACLNADCSTLYTDPVTMTLAPAAGWTATAPATLAGGNVLSFSNGSAVLQLRNTTVGQVAVEATASTPTVRPNSETTCSTADCLIDFVDSGFIFDVPTLIAAKPQSVTLRAVKKDDLSQACVPGFADVSRTLSFSSAYNDPDTGSQPVVVNGASVTSSPTALSLDFDSTGSTPLTVRYDDAGQMILNASYSGTVANDDAGLSMNGSDLFVSKPYGLRLQTDTLAGCTSADTNCPVFPGGVRAGDPFELRIAAVAWQSDGEALTAVALADNMLTPNFRLGDIALSSAVVGPSGGDNGSLMPLDYDHARGNQTTIGTSISEVGVFRLSATPMVASYFGESVSGGISDLVGRFTPAYLGASGSASLTPSCGSFSYQGQPMEFASAREPQLTVSGLNRQSGVTLNYDRGLFWRLTTPLSGTYGSTTGLSVDTRLQTQGTVSSAVEGADNGDGARVYRWTGEQLLYAPGTLPVADDIPFMARLSQTFAAAQLTDADGVCHGGGLGCSEFSYPFTDEPGSEVRLGRLRIDNAHGSELQGLSLPINIETWQVMALGVNGFRLEGLDNCSAALLGVPVLDSFSGQLAADETTASRTGPAAGFGLLNLTAPGVGNEGSVQVSFANAPTWLQYPWDGASRSAARGLASFGIYKGAPPLIFRRELYRLAP